MKSERLRVLVIDDSATVRQAFASLLASDFDVDTAADPLIAQRRLQRKRPAVIVLDLQMPRMDGMTFLRRLMRHDPLPVVICSEAAAKGSDRALRALEMGAVDVLQKPRLGVREYLADSTVLVADTLRAAAQARVQARSRVPMPVTERLRADVVLPAIAPAMAFASGLLQSGGPVVAVGASTGGTEALRTLITALPPTAPPLLVVQHMPRGFTAAFAQRLDAEAAVEVKEAENGDLLRPGRVLVAPGDRHLLMRRIPHGYAAVVVDGPLVSRHRPSVDVLFRSAAQVAGDDAVGVILTGMGNDGAAGLSEMRAKGARTIAQDEATSVVFGMPKEAIAAGAVEQVLPLGRIAAAILRPRVSS
jgi:two-component system chemotaxis response regulator CheB